MFNQIVCVDDTGLTSQGLSDLQAYSAKKVKIFRTAPASGVELINRATGSDCMLVSWKTPIPAEVICELPELKYIALCCSLYGDDSSNVDLATARERGIIVSGVSDYGDQGVVEFIIAQVIMLFKGLGGLQWGKEPVEVAGRRLGIIGFGTTGQQVAYAMRDLGMKVCYFSRTRKPFLEDNSLLYATFDHLLSTSDVISLHLPRNTGVLDARAFGLIKPNAVLVNTSLGPVFDVEAFRKWIAKGDNYAIFDSDGASPHSELFSRYGNVVCTRHAAGWTAEARRRLTKKVLRNIECKSNAGSVL